MKNIRGIFKVKFGDKEYDTRATFEIHHTIQDEIYAGKNITVAQVLNRIVADSDSVDFLCMARVMYVSMQSAGDNRLTFEDLTDLLMEHGPVNYVAWYLDFLTALVIGTSLADAIIKSEKDTKKKR